MTLCRPKVFFDTCVYFDAVKHSGGITVQDWRFVDQYVQNHYQVLVSWTTLKEPLCRLENCGDEYFPRNQDALKLASRHGRGSGGFLEKPQIFAIRSTLGIDVYPRLDREGRPSVSHQKWAEGVVDAVFRATSKRELSISVKLGPKTKMYGTFDLSDFAAHEEQARSEFVRLCEGWRAGQIDEPRAITVAANLLSDSGVEPYTEICERLSLALDAVNMAIEWFWNQSKVHNYNFERRKNNWDDIQQLYYLCDPSMIFVTLNTKDFPKWTKHSIQAAQVVSWREFVEKARRSVAANTTR